MMYDSIFAYIYILKYTIKKGEGDDSSSHVKREGGGGGGGHHHGTSPEDLQNKVFVGGLPLHVDKEGLTDFFSCFGPVTDVSYITLYM